MEPFGSLISRLRTSRNLTQEELATQARCSQGTIAKVEQGDRPRWRRATTFHVYRALWLRQPLSDSETNTYAHWSGISVEALVNFVKQSVPPMSHERSAAGTSFDRLLAVTTSDYVRGVLDALYIAHTLKSPDDVDRMGPAKQPKLTGR